MADMLSAILNVVVGVILVTSVVIVTLKAVNTSTWTTSEVAIFGVTGIMAVVSLVYLIKNNLM